MDDKDLQQKYIAFQQIDQQLQQVEKQIQAFDEHLADIAAIKESLDELKTVRQGTEILVPVSQGIFMRTTLKDADRLVVNIGGKATIEKDVEGTKKLLSAQIADIENAREEALRLMQSISKKAQQLQGELEKTIKK